MRALAPLLVTATFLSACSGDPEAAADAGGAAPDAGAAATLDLSFGTQGYAQLPADVQSGCQWMRAVPGGGVAVALGQPSAVVRFGAGGHLDPGFNGGGVVHLSTPGNVSGFLVRADGSMLVAGPYSGTGKLVDLRADGQLDPGFGAAGTAELPYGWYRRVAAVGDASVVVDHDLVVRVGASGRLDAAFGDGGVVTLALPAAFGPADDPIVLPDGRLLLDGFHGTDTDEGHHSEVVRYAADGRLDVEAVSDVPFSRFNGPPVLDGKGGVFLVEAVGPFTGPYSSPTTVRLVHLDADLHPDPAFGQAGRSVAFPPNLSFNDLFIMGVQKDGKVVAAGRATEDLRTIFLRFRADGSYDDSYHGGVLELHDIVAAYVDFSCPPILDAADAVIVGTTGGFVRILP